MPPGWRKARSIPAGKVGRGHRASSGYGPRWERPVIAMRGDMLDGFVTQLAWNETTYRSHGARREGGEHMKVEV